MNLYELHINEIQTTLASQRYFLLDWLQYSRIADETFYL